MNSPLYRAEQLTARWTLRQFAAYFIALFVLAGVFTLSAIDPVFTAGLVVLGVVIAGMASAVEIVRAYEKRALSVVGEYRGLLDPGLHFVPPFVSQTYRFDLRTQTLDVPQQEAITRDNSPVTADAIVYIRVMDPERAFLEVDDYRRATSLLAQTTLRAVLGNMTLDDTLSQREDINERIRAELDEPTDEWGVRVESVEVRSVEPTQGVVSAMEQQSGAERRRRAMILEAQGERVSAIERAEGDKRANVTHAEGEKLAQILEAQGNAVSTVLGARAAESMGERAIIDTGLETLGAVGQNDSNAFVFPQELTSLLGRYGTRLSGSDVRSDATELESQLLDPETRELLDLDSIEAIGSGE
ncbi:SPFH domain-containing protein [Halocatena pleomorpha]|uniref:Phosphoesterase n=1 Tax=Halocatena pleomorpha TaxID=1785090 RepID=A0A3P3RFQ0_9EURY|nr:SPFH domain-containing protein [Halocatena pleomorpha]RRJ32204.1 phosphoesterase [Halocatena pleomorpha]